MAKFNTIQIEVLKATKAVPTLAKLEELIEQFSATFSSNDVTLRDNITDVLASVKAEKLIIDNCLCAIEGKININEEIFVCNNGVGERLDFSGYIQVKNAKIIELASENEMNNINILCEARADAKAKDLLEEYASDDNINLTYKAARLLSGTSNIGIGSIIKLHERIAKCRKGSKTHSFLTSLLDQFNTWSNSDSEYKNPWTMNQYKSLMEMLYPRVR